MFEARRASNTRVTVALRRVTAVELARSASAELSFVTSRQSSTKKRGLATALIRDEASSFDAHDDSSATSARSGHSVAVTPKKRVYAEIE